MVIINILLKLMTVLLLRLILDKGEVWCTYSVCKKTTCVWRIILETQPVCCRKINHRLVCIHMVLLNMYNRTYGRRNSGGPRR